MRTGDATAFDALFRAHYAGAVRVAERVLRDRATAEDIAQEVFLELWRRRESLTDDLAPGPYTMQAARNRALNHLRHLAVRRRTAEILPHVHEPAPPADHDVAARDLQAAITTAMDALPPRAREVFELSRDRGLRYAEIADLLGITVKAVEGNMARALRQLRERLAPWLPGPDPEG
jgi:RNA polymerase sigma-70 factor (ECF subfamily)